MGLRRPWLVLLLLLILGPAYLLRAESSLTSAHQLPDQPSQHNQIAAPDGGGMRPTDGDATKEKQQQLRPTSGTKGKTTGKTHFADDASENVTALVGQPSLLLCRVNNLGNRTVSWIRKRDLHILTSMAITYTSDGRFTVVPSPADTSDDWNLRIDYVQPRDEGTYECQVNTEPKIHKAVYLRVLDVQAEILSPDEVFVRKGSTISLTCSVNSQGVPPSNVTWYHAGAVIDFDGPRGGVSLETEKSKGGTTSKLLITRASFDDSGNYSCVSSKAAQATVVVHVLNGEQPAAMQHGEAAGPSARCEALLLLLGQALLLAASS